LTGCSELSLGVLAERETGKMRFVRVTHDGWAGVVEVRYSECQHAWIATMKPGAFHVESDSVATPPPLTTFPPGGVQDFARKAKIMVGHHIDI